MRQERYANARDPQYAASRETPGAVVGAGDVPALVRRVSWGAIFAGVIVMLVINLLLNLLGLAIGVATIDPTGQSPTASSLTIGGAIWWVASSLIAVFVGGWVAARLSGEPIRMDGLLHGIVTWGLSTLVMFYLVTSLISSVVGGAFNIIGSALGVAAKGAEGTAQVAAQQPQGPLADVQRQIQGMIGQAMQGVQQGTQQAQQITQDPQARQVIQKAVTSGPESLTPADRDAAVNAMMQYGNMTRPQAEQRLADWQAQYQEAKQRAKEAADVAAKRVSQAALWSFVALVLGAIAGAAGGMIGAPRDIRARVA